MPTTRRGYPYPTGAQAPAGPVQIQQLAEAVDADVNALLPRSGPVSGSVVVQTAVTKRVDFPTGTNFSARPNVVVSMGADYATAVSIAVALTDLTGFTVEIRNPAGAAVNTGNFRINYIADGIRS